MEAAKLRDEIKILQEQDYNERALFVECALQPTNSTNHHETPTLVLLTFFTLFQSIALVWARLLLF